MSIIDKFKNRKVFVKNAKQDEYTDISNALELYYEHFPTHRRTSAICPSCGEKMFRQKTFNDLLIKKHPIIVGGHLKLHSSCFSEKQVYLLPICENCNNKKDNLKPFEVNISDLLPI